MGLPQGGRQRGGKGPFRGKRPGQGRFTKGGPRNGPYQPQGGPGMYGPPRNMGYGNPQYGPAPPPYYYGPQPPFPPPPPPGPYSSSYDGRGGPTLNSRFCGKSRGKGRYPVKKSDDSTAVNEIELNKPWVTEEIKTEETKKQDILKKWRQSKNDTDWAEYKTQKQKVKEIYDLARSEYIASHPEEAHIWKTYITRKKMYFCDTCDKSFKDEEKLYVHESQHETCGQDGCQFTAHPKVIAKHIQIQHVTGLYKKITHSYSPEEVAKWIELRRKRFPSLRNVAQKKQIEEEKFRRGERINEDKHRFNSTFTQRHRRKFKRKRFSSLSTKKFQHPKKQEYLNFGNHLIKTEVSDDIEIEIRGGIMPFTGTGSILENSESENEDDKINDKNMQYSDTEWIDHNLEKTNETTSTQTLTLNNSLGLLAMYGSNDESDMDDPQITEPKMCIKQEPKEVCSVVPRAIEIIKKVEEIKVEDTESDSGPEEVKTIHSMEICEDDKSMETREHKRKRKHTSKRRNKIMKHKHIKTELNDKKNIKFQKCLTNERIHSPTLLEKLLTKEIRHERNVILQCVRYVVTNNFLQTT